MSEATSNQSNNKKHESGGASKHHNHQGGGGHFTRRARFGRNTGQVTNPTMSQKIPILKYGASNNFFDWIRKMKEVCTAKHGRVATVLMTQKMPIVPIPLYQYPAGQTVPQNVVQLLSSGSTISNSNAPTLASQQPKLPSEDDDTSSSVATSSRRPTRRGAAQAAVAQQGTAQQQSSSAVVVDPSDLISNRVNLKIFESVASKHMEMHDEASKMFGTLLSHMSDESKEQVKRSTSQWEHIEESQDLVALVRLLYKTHQTQISGIDAIDHLRIKDNFGKLHQYGGESISEYIRRAIECIYAFDSVQLPRPSDEEQAARFLEGLSSEYAQLKADLRNQAIRGIAHYPDNLTDACEIAREYVVTKRVAVNNQNGNSSSGKLGNKEIVFVTNADNVNHKRKGKHNGNKSKPHAKKHNDHPQQEGSNQLNAMQGSNNVKKADTKSAGTGASRGRWCKICRCGDHWTSDCRNLDEAIELFDRNNSTTKLAQVQFDEDAYLKDDMEEKLGCHVEEGEEELVHPAFKHSPLLTRFDVLLDNQATVNVFKDRELLHSIDSCETGVRINGIGGHVTAQMTGVFDPFGRVLYCEKAFTNVISLGWLETQPGFDIRYVKGDCFIVSHQPSGRRFVFKRKESKSGGALFVFNAKHLSIVSNKRSHGSKVEQGSMPRRKSGSFVTTVEANEMKYTKREVESAKEARNLMIKLGYISSKDLIYLLSNGGIVNSNVTPKDVLRAIDIYGKTIGELKGKTVDRKTKDIQPVDVQHSIQVDQEIYGDVMFVEGQPYLLTVSAPLGLTVVIDLKGKRDEDHVWDALQTTLSEYQRRGFKILNIHSDGEGAIGKCENKLRAIGIGFNPAGAGKHVPIVERRIRVVKERIRAVLNALPYTLPKVLLPSLVKYCVLMVNNLPSSLRSDSISPKEAFTGIKLDAKRDLRVGFGDYCQIYIPNQTKNSMEPRTEGGIALLPKGNRQGSVYFMLLDSRRIVLRDQFQLLPIPNDVVKLMNKMANGLTSNLQEIENLASMQDSKQFLYEEIFEQGQHQQGSYVKPVSSESPASLVLPSLPNRMEVQLRQLKSNDGIKIEAAGTDPTTSSLIDGKPALNTATEDYSSSSPTPAVVNVVATKGKSDDETVQIRLIKPTKVDNKSHISFRTGLKRYKNNAIEAARKEMAQMIEKKVFEPTFSSDIPKSSMLIYSTMFYKEKFDPLGNFEKLKARWVAGGDKQKILDKIKHSSPTLDLTSFMIIACRSAKFRKRIAAVDIGGAFLNASRRGLQPIYVTIEPLIAQLVIQLKPEWRKYMRKDGSLVVLLNQALYGCIDSPELWYKEISSFLKSIGFSQHPLDECVFSRQDVIVCLYVDDLFIVTDSEEELSNLIQVFKDRYNEISEKRGKEIPYLGMSLCFNEDGSLSISMPKHVHQILSTVKVSKTSQTPATTQLFVVNNDSPVLSIEEKDGFRSIVASLLYVSKRIRPDILLPTQFLATRVSNPTLEDKHKLIRILQYLNGTKELSLKLRYETVGHIYGYIDSSYGIHQNGKGQTGILVSLGSGPIYVRSSKQRLVGKSSTEAELIGVSDGISTLIWIKDFLQHLSWVNSDASSSPIIKLLQDNTSSMKILANGKAKGELTKHINIRYCFVKDYIDRRVIELKHVKTEFMLADLFTKPLPKDQFLRLRRLIMGM